MKQGPAIAFLTMQIVLLAAPTLQLTAQNPLTALEDAAKEKLAGQAIEKLLNDQLPLTLNADDVYPTVTTLPGSPFNPTPLHLTADQLNQPLPPGDYTINTLDFCSEYSVHAPGAGVAYVLGPYEGKAADAIGNLIWRGTVQYGIAPQTLQAVSWAIQSGLTYSQMPQTYQAVIDQVIPDFKSEITGDFVVGLETTYNNAAKTAKLPPLDTMLAKMGGPGQLALDAERQRAILTAQNTSDQLREQTLFQGQESGLYTPVAVENGPWTERVKGQVYMKLLIAGGNMATNNVMQIRVLPSSAENASNAPGNPRLVRASYGEPQTAPAVEGSSTSVSALMQGMLGYSQGRGAQALGQVPVVAKSAPQPPTPVLAGTLVQSEGLVSIIRAGTTTLAPLNPNDPVYEGDTVVTGHLAKAELVFKDNSMMLISEKSKLKIADYLYDASGASHNKASYGILQGAFQYVSGLLAKSRDHDINLDTPYGGIGVRGTELIVKSDGTPNNLEIDLISGSIALTPNGSTAAGPTMSAPVQIEISPAGMQVLPLTQDQYNSILAQITTPVPTS